MVISSIPLKQANLPWNFTPVSYPNISAALQQWAMVLEVKMACALRWRVLSGGTALDFTRFTKKGLQSRRATASLLIKRNALDFKPGYRYR